MSNESELYRRPRALTNFLHLREPGIQAQRHIEDFRKLEPLNHYFPMPMELCLLIPHTIGIKKSLDEIANPEDIEKRMRFQVEKFTDLTAKNTLTPEWRKFGLKHNKAIGALLT